MTKRQRYMVCSERPKGKPLFSLTDLPLNRVFLSSVRAHHPPSGPSYTTSAQLCLFYLSSFSLSLSLDSQPITVLMLCLFELLSCLSTLSTSWCRSWSILARCLCIVSCLNRTFFCVGKTVKFIPELRRKFMIRPVDTKMRGRASRQADNIMVATATASKTGCWQMPILVEKPEEATEET